jgi:hypothetical protein
MEHPSSYNMYHTSSQLSQPFIPQRNRSGEYQGQFEAADFSIPRKPVSSTSEIASSVDQKGLYQKVHLAENSRETRGRKRFELLRTWWLEFLSCALFAGALVGLIFTIRPYEGRPLPQWPYRLTINSLIAVYTVILRAPMLFVAAEGLSQLKWRWFDRDRPLKDLLHFDNASRGPWGCLNLLWRLRGSQLVSSCGAFISIAALIIDPFTQQIIATYDCRMPDEGTPATIPRTNDFQEVGPHIGAALNTISLGLQSYINAGIFDPGRSVAFACPTGNCTFSKEYHTVGYCSECNDTTNRLVLDEQTTNTSTSWNLSSLGPDDFSGVKDSAIMSSNGSSQYLVMESSLSGETNIIAGYMKSNQSKSCAETCPSLEEKNHDKCEKNWKDIKWGCASLPDLSRGIGAASCSLFPCVRTYSARVDQGRWQETLLSTSKEWDQTPGLDHITVNVDCLDSNDQALLRDAGYNYEGKSWIPYDPSIDQTFGNSSAGDGSGQSVSGGTVSEECIYQTTVLVQHGIAYFLSSFLNGTIVPGSYNYEYRGPATLLAIYNEADVTFERVNDTWQNISDSITIYMREHGQLNSSAPALGEAFRGQACVHIQWPFLAYPAALVLLAIVFFFWMVIETRQRETSRHDWKSSSLALLFHGLDRASVPLPREYRTEMIPTKEMDELAERTSVRLSRAQGGWLFRGSDFNNTGVQEGEGSGGSVHRSIRPQVPYSGR